MVFVWVAVAAGLLGFRTASAGTLQDALDNNSVNFTVGGNAPWAFQTALTHDGIDAARSGLISDSQVSYFEATLTAPGTLSFWWKVSSEYGFDGLIFYLDGVAQTSISGEVGWTQATFAIPIGTHSVRWEYYKDSSASSGADAGWVDQIVWTETGVCGSSHGKILSAAPATNLCLSGTASAVTGSGPWYWSCQANTNASSVACNAYNPGYSAITLPQTGQTGCWDSVGNAIGCAGTSQDGETLLGDARPSSRLTNNNDGTITDNLTGLMWVQDANLMNSRDPAFDDLVTVYGVTYDGAVSWQRALDYIKKLNSEKYLGFNDWRLPNFRELESLLGDQNTDQAIGNDIFAWLAANGFVNVVRPNVSYSSYDGYWSSTTNFWDGKYAWTIDVGHRTMIYRDKSWALSVWPVRSPQTATLPRTGQVLCADTSGAVIDCAGTGQDGDLRSGVAWPDPRFVDNGDNTVTDVLTGLVWTKDANTPTLDACPSGYGSWSGALDYIRCLNNNNFLGHNDWRLPNRAELSSVANFNAPDPADWLIASGVLVNRSWTQRWTSDSDITLPSFTPRNDIGGNYPMTENKGSSNNVWPVRGGASAKLLLSPQSIDFGSAYPEQVLTRAVTVSNPLATAVTVSAVSVGGSNATDFALGDTCSGRTLAPNGSCSIPISFTPLSCGNKNAAMTVSSTKGDYTVSLAGLACGTGTANLKGNVLDAQTLQPLANATVTVGTLPAVTTDASGNYQFSALAAGSYELVVTKAGYKPWRSFIPLLPLETAVKNVHLFPTTWTGVNITAINSKYSTGKTYYFLPDIDSFTTVDFTAYVDWGGKTPGTVRFITPGGSYDVATTTNSATKAFNIATTFPPCSTLKAVAIAADGTTSPEAAADFLVTKPLAATPLAFVSDIDGFSYKTAVPVKAEFLKSLGTAVDSTVPIFGSHPFLVNYIPEMDVSFKSDGTGSYKFSWKNKALGESLEKDYYQHRDFRKFKTNYQYLELLKAESEIYKTLGQAIPLPAVNVGGRELTFFPLLDVGVEFNPNSCSNNEAGWKYKGSAGFAGDFKYEAVRQNVTPLGPIPVPWYVKFTLSLGGDFTLSVNDLFAKKFTGTMNLNPSVAGSFGVGVHEMGAAEGTLTMGAETKWLWPSVNPMHLEEMALFLEEKARLYMGPWEWNTSSYRQTWCLAGPCAQQAPPLPAENSAEPVLISRDYLNAGTVTFESAPSLAVRQFATASQTYNVSTASLSSATFPVSNPSLTSAGSSTNLLWIADNASRSPINRTMLVHSAYNGSTWSAPAPVADDGTGDANPTALTFSDGTIVAAWENVQGALADTATFPEMLAKMEIAAAVFNPATKSWGPAVRLSSNATLDRSPKLAGTAKNNLLLTWIGNDQNDLLGSAAKPNKLWYARYNGSAWSQPAVAATVPYGINRYSVAYDGTVANVVLSLDTDGNAGTITDLELFRLSYANGTWGGLSRLTTDAVIDDNPQLALAANGAFLLTWVKGGELSSVTGFDFSQRTVIRREEEYSSTLADFKQATAADGKIAVIYADTSDAGSSDLFAAIYDPNFKLWGNPLQLTADAHTEQRPTLAFLGNDTLMACYNRKLLINADGSLATGTYTELAMLKHALGDDLALKVGSLAVDPANAPPGSGATLSVVAQNVGDKAAQNIAVVFYQGNPAAGGTAIDGATIAGPLRPGEEQTVAIPWTIPQGSAPLTVYAVIDPVGVIDTVNRTNNTLSLAVAAPDLGVRTLSGEKVGPGRFRLVASVFNNGGTASPASTLTLRSDSATGAVLASLPVKGLERFESVDLTYDWNASAVAKPYYTAVATVDEANAIAEGDENNNSFQVSLPGDQQDVQAWPAALSFGTVAAGQKATRELLVSNAGTAPLAVSNVTAGSPFVVTPGGSIPCPNLSPTLLPGVSCSLEVSVTPMTSGSWNTTAAITSDDPDTPVTSLPVSASVPVTTSRLSVTLTGAATGTVTSSPAGIACLAGTCSSAFVQGSTVTLLATPSLGAAFNGWSGACGGTGNCSVALSSDKSVVAAFMVRNPLVKRAGTPPAFFASLGTAGSSVATAEAVTFLAQEGDFTEDLLLAGVAERTLQGGYDNTFASSSGYSRLLGNLTIAGGSLTVDRLIIGGTSDGAVGDGAPVIMLADTPATYYSTFELAYEAAANGGDLRPIIIKTGTGTITNGLTLDRNLALTLLGGLDSTLTRGEGYLHIKGALVVESGSLVVDRIVVE